MNKANVPIDRKLWLDIFAKYRVIGKSECTFSGTKKLF